MKRTLNLNGWFIEELVSAIDKCVIEMPGADIQNIGEFVEFCMEVKISSINNTEAVIQIRQKLAENHNVVAEYLELFWCSTKYADQEPLDFGKGIGMLKGIISDEVYDQLLPNDKIKLTNDIRDIIIGTSVIGNTLQKTYEEN